MDQWHEKMALRLRCWHYGSDVRDWQKVSPVRVRGFVNANLEMASTDGIRLFCSEAEYTDLGHFAIRHFVARHFNRRTFLLPLKKDFIIWNEHKYYLHSI